jgi:hypothetical protein
MAQEEHPDAGGEQQYPHQTSLPGSAVSRRATMPDETSDQPRVVRCAMVPLRALYG